MENIVLGTNKKERDQVRLYQNIEFGRLELPKLKSVADKILCNASKNTYVQTIYEFRILNSEKMLKLNMI